MTVSIITAIYNSSDFISETIESVISQQYTDWEMIIIDDFSDDNSVSIVQSYMKKDSRIKLIELLENAGPAVARNTGIRAAKGRYISFLDSDDVWKPEKLSTQISFMKKHNVAFCFSGYDKIDESGKVIGENKVPQRITYHQLLKKNVIGCLTAVYDTQRFGKVYMPLLRKRQDFGLWLRLLRVCNSAVGVEQSLAFYRVRSCSVSSNKFIAAKYNWEIYRKVEKLGLFSSVYYFVHYSLSGVLGYTFIK